MTGSATLLGVMGLALYLPATVVAAQASRVIDNPAPVWKRDEGLRLAPEPVLVIGPQQGEMYEFDRVAGSARLGDGRIVVADGGSTSLRFFDSTGNFLASVGRKGGGPGEFSRLEAFFALPGDTLVAGANIGDLSYFTGTGGYLERRGTMNPPIPMAGSGLAVALAPINGSGTRAVGKIHMPSPRGPGARWVDSFPVAIVDSGNAEIRPLGMLPSMEFAMGSDGPRQPWFGPMAVFASRGGRFYIGFGGAYAIRVYTSRGELEYTIRRAWTPVRVTSADIDAYVVEWGKRWSTMTGGEAAAERRAMRHDPYAATVPAFSQFLPDRAGRLWVREAHLADAPGAGALNTTPLVPSRWSVFDPSGRWLGDVLMPAHFQPHDIGADYVLGAAVDEDGVQSIVMYRLLGAPLVH